VLILTGLEHPVVVHVVESPIARTVQTSPHHPQPAVTFLYPS